jgi:hypothetical protein
MQLNLNSLKYGNPTKEIKASMIEKSYLDDLFPLLKENTPPDNDSDLTKEEINELIGLVEDISLEDNEKVFKRYVFYDRNLKQAIVNSFRDTEFDLEKLINDIVFDTKPLIFKLKYFFNRPRPYQLASVFKANLFPFNSKSAHTASYPSGHTIQAAVILNVIANLSPNNYEKSKKMIEDIGYSRLYLGVHYATDNDFSFKVAQEIIKHPNFTKKYGI